MMQPMIGYIFEVWQNEAKLIKAINDPARTSCTAARSFSTVTG
jgi:hypothetical protein